ncbi:conjugal transfer protein [Pantoea ananatis 15320]|uniref:ATPase, T2SS/T4P/T4SS family n=1 Tax=Pantoea ananas TaxID=553 RepID=UPI000411C0C0|nr:ATPase, T2SS/T4P/T4SS family [Pantoea ananatis]PKC36296.1 conjugal transfer protein [Pantoea ananatis 15320]
MTATALNEVDFIDLYLGEDYAEIKGLVGESRFLTTVPESLMDDVQRLKAQCLNSHRESGRSEFSLFHGDRLYRATVNKDLRGQQDLVLRQTPAGVRPFNSIPLSTPLRRSVELPSAAGLILIAGDMGSGKTTTAASILSRRIAVTGTLGVSIEDPVEALLQGRHGDGRCIQLEVRENEGYASAVRKAYRMGAGAFFLGEIRDAATAHEVLRASLSMFVVSTIHGSSWKEALERYAMFCEAISPSAKANIASTLYVLAHQTMRTNPANNSRSVDITGFNLRNTPARDTIQAKITAGNFRLDDQFANIHYEF